MTRRPRPRSRWHHLRADDGAALVSVLYLLVALTAITTTVAVVATNDIISSGRDQQATAALATADAGVAQALQFIRANGVGELRCLEVDSTPTPVNACATTPTTPAERWSSPVRPQQVRLDGTAGDCVTGQACYRVWISIVRRYDPALGAKVGTYRIHSTGYFGGGPGAKAVTVDFEATPTSFPVGVFGERLDGGGGTNFVNTSLFTRACVSPRQSGSGAGTRFEGLDKYWDQPSAAHSTDRISTANNCGATGEIHRTSACATGTGNALVNDRDSFGGPVASGSPCWHTHRRADGSWYPDGDTTAFTVTDLQRYGYRPGGLSDAEYESLRVKAQGLGLHNPTAAQLSAGLTAAATAGVSHPVVYYDNGTPLALSSSDIPEAYARNPTTAGACSPRALVVVVRRASVIYQGGNSVWRTMSVFVPEGNFTGNGGYNVVGTLFADSITMGGNQRWQMDDCFVTNMPGPILNLTTTAFREDDRSDIG